MTDYNDGKWHGWNGGECPVHPKTEVNVCFMGQTGFTQKAGELNWKGVSRRPITSFKVVKEHKKPREFWVRFIAEVGGFVQAPEGTEGAFLVQEKLE